MARNYVDLVNKNITYFIRFPDVPGKQEHFHVISGKLVYYFRGDSTIVFGQN